MIHRESGLLKTSYQADMALYPLPIARWAVAAIAALAFLVEGSWAGVVRQVVLVVPLLLSDYYLSILNLVSVAIVGALGLNILVGYTGQVSIGHGAFMSVGAYTAANLATRLDAPFWISLPIGGLMAAAVGAV